jgi:hypothetical protein
VLGFWRTGGRAHRCACSLTARGSTSGITTSGPIAASAAAGSSEWLTLSSEWRAPLGSHTAASERTTPSVPTASCTSSGVGSCHNTLPCAGQTPRFTEAIRRMKSFVPQAWGGWVK